MENRRTLTKERKGTSGIFAAILKTFMSLSGKVLPVAGKLLNGITGGKALLAVASLGVYSYMFTWQFALMILVMVGLHESGHVYAMKKLGIPTKGFYFLPFFGGVAVGTKRAESHEGEYYIAIMGPIWGLFVSIATAIAYFITKEPLLAAGASWMALVNMINLLPIFPMDGGRVLSAIGGSIHDKLGAALTVVSVLICGAISIFLHSTLFAVLFVIGLIEIVPIRKVVNYLSQFYILRLIGSIILVIVFTPILLIERVWRWIKTKRMKNNIQTEEVDEDIEDDNEDEEEADTTDEVSDVSEVLSSPVLDEVITLKKMTNLQMLLAFIGYIATTGTLLFLMFMMEHAPGADAAMHVLIDR